MDIEKAWLSGFFKLDNADRRRALLESRPEYFQQYEREYMYLSDSLKNLGVVVTERTFSERFPDFTLEPHEEALSLFTKELENRRLYELSQNGIGAVIKALENGGTGHDVRCEILKLSERLKTATMCESSDWLDDTEREEDYKRRRQMQSKSERGTSRRLRSGTSDLAQVLFCAFSRKGHYSDRIAGGREDMVLVLRGSAGDYAVYPNAARVVGRR